uniref:Ribosomal protein S12 n=1 Tax=Heterorhabditis bacteriophora TaxID=37862 RepID=A0A1I7X0Y8_HETBA
MVKASKNKPIKDSKSSIKSPRTTFI